MPPTVPRACDTGWASSPTEAAALTPSTINHIGTAAGPPPLPPPPAPALATAPCDCFRLDVVGAGWVMTAAGGGATARPGPLSVMAGSPGGAAAGACSITGGAAGAANPAVTAESVRSKPMVQGCCATASGTIAAPVFPWLFQ